MQVNYIKRRYFLKKRINWMKVPLAIIFVVSLTYTIGKYILDKYFNLLFRDWVWTWATIISIFCFLIIEINVLIKLNNILEKKLPIKKIWKSMIRILCFGLIGLVNLYALFGFVFSMGLSYEEIGIETYNGEKYVVRNTAKWLDNYPRYYYHPYKNLFVYDKGVAYSVESGEVIWEEYSDIDNDKELDISPNIIGDTTDDIVIVEEEIEIIPSRIAYVQNINENLDYGFYLLDRAGHQYSYAFIQSNDNGLSWKVIYQFPANSEIYYTTFLNTELGFINFGSSEGLSFFMTTDSGLTWKKVLIDLLEENKNMLYVKDVKKNGEEIEVILGAPSWSNSKQFIKYISADKGLSWNLQM